MFTIDKINIEEQIINKSRFICTLFPIKDANEANNILKEIRKKYYDATHNCYAYVYGDNAQYAKNSDDGEPSQTAGIVIYDVLKKNSLTNVLAVVTRYFGGIKLGAGGLVRAYSSSTALAVKSANIIKIEKKTTLTIKVNYNNYNIISKLIDETWITEKIFSENITLKLLMPDSETQNLINKLKDLTKNQIEIYN